MTDTVARPNPTTGRATVRRCLVVEDELDHCEMIAECFASGADSVDMVFAHTVEEACTAIQTGRFSFVLLDHNLPDGSGLDVLERMEAELLTTPVIGLSTSSDPQVALGDFRGGAIEFLTKHEAFQGDTLRRRVLEVLSGHKRRLTATMLERSSELQAIRRCDEALIAASRTDSLLQIFNRAAFEDILQDAHERARAGLMSYTLCLADVDQFKKYNDHHGHAAGDEALKAVAAALSGAIRPDDTIARYGGEEIAIVLAGARPEFVQRVVNRLCEKVCEVGLEHGGLTPPGAVTVSIGAAVVEKDTIESMNEVIERTDQALYRAKAGGRNRAIVDGATKGA